MLDRKRKAFSVVHQNSPTDVSARPRVRREKTDSDFYSVLNRKLAALSLPKTDEHGKELTKSSSDFMADRWKVSLANKIKIKEPHDSLLSPAAATPPPVPHFTTALQLTFSDSAAKKEKSSNEWRTATLN